MPTGPVGGSQRRRQALEQGLPARIGSDGRNNADAGVPRSAILEESASRNSHENAAYTSRLLLAHNLHKVLLITSAMTMPRALPLFGTKG